MPGNAKNIGFANFNSASSTFSLKNTSRAAGCMDTLLRVECSSPMEFKGSVHEAFVRLPRQRLRALLALILAEFAHPWFLR